MTEALSPALLQQITARIFEEAAFIFTEAVAGAPPPFVGDVIEARVTFSGPSSGTVSLATSAELSTALAANLLGIEPDDPDAGARARDAIGEMLNIIAGVLIGELFGPEVIGRLGIPQVELRGSEGYHVDGSVVSLLTEEGQRIDAGALLEAI
jgi:hypothetical protein